VTSYYHFYHHNFLS